jgi:hypothetical protein
MAVSLTHATAATGTDSGDGRVSKNAWNEEHDLTAATSKLLGTTGASTTVGELSLGTGLALDSSTLTIISGGDYETVADAEAATILAAAQTLRTSGYTTAGDGGHGLYKRMAAAPSDPTNAGYLRSVDRYTSAGATDATHGGYWQLVPEGGIVRIEQFGGVADATSGAVGTDNYTALRNALDFATFAPYSPEPALFYTEVIKFGIGKYRIAQTVEIVEVAKIVGCGGNIDSQGLGLATQLHFPADTTGFIISNSNTSGESGTFSGVSGVDWRTAGGTTLEGFSIHMSGTDVTKRGVHSRTIGTLRRIMVLGCPGTAFYIHATAGSGGATEGNVNDFVVEDCMAHTFGRHALRFEGNDANVIRVTGFKTAGNGSRGCAILDESGSGCNVYMGIDAHIYGNQGVHYGGRRYRLIDSTAGVGEGTTPGTDDLVWYDWGAGASAATFPDWDSGEEYFPELPILCTGAPSVFIGCYRELDGPTHAPNGALVIGGNVGGTKYTNFLGGTEDGLFNNTGAGGLQTYLSGQTGYTYNEGETFAGVGLRMASEEPDKGIGILVAGRAIDGSANLKLRYYEDDIIWGRESGAKRVEEIMTASSALTFGRAAAVIDTMLLPGVILQSTSDATASRFVGMITDRPTSGDRATGEFYHETNPGAWGAAAWIVTTGHATTPTTHSVPVFGLTSVTPQYNGALVVECTSNTVLTFKYKGSDGTIRSGTIALAP